MALLYNYTYLNANGYLNRFRAALKAPMLDRATLTKILKIFNENHKYEFNHFIVAPEGGGSKCLYSKKILNMILGIDDTGYQRVDPKFNKMLDEVRRIFDGIEEKEIMGQRPVRKQQYEPIDYSSPEEDMGYVSNQLANLEEAFVNREPQYKKIIDLTYSVIPPQEEGDDITYVVKKFQDYDYGYYTDFNEECNFDDLVYYFGRDIANAILDGKGERDKDGNFVLDFDKEKSIDITDVNAVNEYAKWQYGTVNDFRAAGYLLTDGSLLDFSGGETGRQYGTRVLDHRNISINGIDMNKFIALGNIRLMPEMPGFEICKKPTEQQVSVLQRFIRTLGMRKGYMMLDIMDENGHETFSEEYEPGEYGRIFSDIDKHIDAGRKKPVYRSEFADFLQENKMKKKRITITESQYNELKQRLSEQHFVEPDKVKIVQKYLDDNFVRGSMPALGEDGYPKMIGVVGMKFKDGNVAKNMTATQLFYLLQDKFNKIYEDPKQRDAFLKKIVVDWYYEKISKTGLLSKNSY